ncbi:hypothetical protein LTR85_004531 [Meristemomyces frigidus]|nr:hypothetical protein LTR85_004531 [Meristemomyces frigidus]
MTIDERKQSKDGLDKEGSITLMPKKNKKKGKPIILRPKDVDFVCETRDVVPVRNSGHIKNCEKQGLWEAELKPMSVCRATDTQVPLTAFSKCCLGRRFTLHDKKRELKRAIDSKDDDSAFESDAASCAYSMKTLDEKLSDGYCDSASSDDWDDSLNPGLEDYSVEELDEMYNDHFVDDFAVSKASVAGDVIVVVAGSAIPFVPRKPRMMRRHRQRSGAFTYVGPAVLPDLLHNPNIQPRVRCLVLALASNVASCALPSPSAAAGGIRTSGDV